jgi:putative endonuclease
MIWRGVLGSTGMVCLVPGFTKRYGIKCLVYYEVFGDIHEAIHRETQLKKYKREWKLNLIQERNLEWRDLVDSL